MLVQKILILAAAATPMASALRSKGSRTGVSGWCDFTWANANKVQNVQCGAKDTANDDHPVYAFLALYSDNGKEKEIARFDNKAGYNTERWDNTKHSWSNLPRSNLSKARVRVCVNIQLGEDKCEWGNFVDNPYESGTS
ncbi:hypothetical protein BU25DRAFT_460606 [Macroventuria anomochaeta]|uniref:Uncharacterized protein n=1 Tax=Macroventuria anomochaeta TaxID=301207 RepID=A0ACB6RW25_9PLEO|nr:uncharacterized protein BU25DRAFT_460606 [Macroventuria anomochaeta]KAF2625134.1 hypothetical protein BU25DRAFT_460606 [Macroventuria anomochaeta]